MPPEAPFIGLEDLRGVRALADYESMPILSKLGYTNAQSHPPSDANFNLAG